MNNGFTNWKIVAETVKMDLEWALRDSKLKAEDAVWNFVRVFGEANDNGPTTDEICWALDHIFGKKSKTSGSHVNALLNKLETEKRMLIGRRGNGYRVPGRIKAI